MPSYAPLPAYQYPTNALINFSPLSDGIDAVNKRQRYQRIGDAYNQGGIDAALKESANQGDQDITNALLQRKVQQQNADSEASLRQSTASYHQALIDQGKVVRLGPGQTAYNYSTGSTYTAPIPRDPNQVQPPQEQHPSGIDENVEFVPTPDGLMVRPRGPMSRTQPKQSNIENPTSQSSAPYANGFIPDGSKLLTRDDSEGGDIVKDSGILSDQYRAPDQNSVSYNNAMTGKRKPPPAYGSYPSGAGAELQRQGESVIQSGRTFDQNKSISPSLNPGREPYSQLPSDAPTLRDATFGEIQRYYTIRNGQEPPKNTVWDADGMPADPKAWEKRRHAADVARPLLQGLKDAGDVLIKGGPGSIVGSLINGGANGSSPLARTIASNDTFGSYLTPAYTEALARIQSTVQMMAAAVEGQRHANAEEVRFLKNFGANPLADADKLKDNINRALQIYNSRVGNYSDASQDYYSDTAFNKQRDKLRLTQQQPQQQGAIAQPPSQSYSSGPAPAGTVQKMPRDVWAQARSAISSGKDPDAVRQRLRQMGYDPADLDR